MELKHIHHLRKVDSSSPDVLLAAKVLDGEPAAPTYRISEA
jgi:hypothetical protein